MAVILPVSLSAQESAAALLRSSGTGVLVNRNPSPESIALFPDDLIETPKNIVARLEITGSAADISPETMVQFETDELALDHGTVSVNTMRGLRVRVGCLTVTPVNVSERTQYDVSDLDGKVTVNAAKNDVYIDARSKKPQEAKNPSRLQPRSRPRGRIEVPRRKMRGRLSERGLHASLGRPDEFNVGQNPGWRSCRDDRVFGFMSR